MKIARRVILGAAITLAAFGQASAQDWPTRSVTVVVPVPAGVASDLIARTVFEQVGKQVVQTFVIENRPGAGGTIGANLVAKAAPDGHYHSGLWLDCGGQRTLCAIALRHGCRFHAGGSVWRDPAGRGDGGRAL